MSGQFMRRKHGRCRGQGIIEYGGALVLAALFISIAIATVDSQFLANIMQSMQDRLAGLLLGS